MKSPYQKESPEIMLFQGFLLQMSFIFCPELLDFYNKLVLA